MIQNDSYLLSFVIMFRKNIRTTKIHVYLTNLRVPDSIKHTVHDVTHILNLTYVTENSDQSYDRGPFSTPIELFQSIFDRIPNWGNDHSSISMFVGK